MPESRPRERDLRISEPKKSLTSAGGSGGGARVSARVTWEDSDRAPLELFFETDAIGAADLAPEPEAFLAACILPAMRARERRVRIEGAVCPRLAAGVTQAIGILRRLHGPPREPVTVEPTEGWRAIVPRRPERSAFFFTGGVDSSDLFRRNRLAHPVGHPRSFADGLSTFGHLCPTDARTMRWNEASGAVLASIAERQEFALTRIRTNVWELAPDVGFLAEESLASALAASAHAFRSRWSAITIASSRDAARERLRGTSPLIDPLYCSGALELRYDSSPATRLERLRAIAASPRGLLEDLIVCLAFPTPPEINCGECEKCVRTMTSLLAIGALGRARRFPHRDVTPERVRAVTIGEHDADYWRDLLPVLAERSRADLVQAIREKLEECRLLVRWSADTGWKGSLRRLDRRYLGGRLLRMRRRLSSRDGAPSRPLADA